MKPQTPLRTRKPGEWIMTERHAASWQYVAVLILAVIVGFIGTGILCYWTVFYFGWPVFFGCVAILVIVVMLSIIQRIKATKQFDAVRDCPHYFIGDTCRACGYCYNLDKK